MMRTGPQHHRTHQSEGGGSGTHLLLAASASTPSLPSRTARNLSMDFFPEATAGGSFIPRSAGGGAGSIGSSSSRGSQKNRGQHPLMTDAVGLEVDDASSIDSQYSSSSASLATGSSLDSVSASGSSSTTTRSDRYESTEQPDPVNTSTSSTSFVRNQSMLSVPHSLDEEQLDGIFRPDGHHDARKEIPRATEIYGSSASLAYQMQTKQVDVEEMTEGQTQMPQQPKSQSHRRQKEYLMSQDNVLSGKGGLDDLGPPGLIESPDSDSSIRKQSSSGIISSTTDDASTRKAKSVDHIAAAVGTELSGRDETTLSELDSSQLSSTQSSIPRTVYYTPQVTPNAKPHHRPTASTGGEAFLISPSPPTSSSSPDHHRRIHSTGGIHFAAASKNKSPTAASTPLSLDSRHHKIDFFCYGDPEEVPSEGEEGYSAPLSPGSYLNTSTLDGSAELEDVARKAASSKNMSPSRDRRGTVITTDDRAGAAMAASSKHVAPAQVVSPSPTKQETKLPATSGDEGNAGGLYTVEDIVRASATAISRVLNLSLNDEVDENMEEITRQAYEILQSTQRQRKSL